MVRIHWWGFSSRLLTRQGPDLTPSSKWVGKPDLLLSDARQNCSMDILAGHKLQVQEGEQRMYYWPPSPYCQLAGDPSPLVSTINLVLSTTFMASTTLALALLYS